MVEGSVVLAPSSGPAPWTFIVGRAFLAAVPADTDGAVVRALLAVTSRTSVDLESMVTLLPQSGDEALASFALVVPQPGSAGATVSVLARGSLAVDVYSIGGSRRFVAGDILPWLLADFLDVTGIVIGDSRAARATFERGGPAIHGTSGAGDRLTWLLTETADAPVVDDTVLVGVGVGTGAAGRFLHTIGGRGTASAETIILPSSSGTAANRADVPEGADAERARYGFRLGEACYRLDGSYILGRRPHPARIRAGGTPTLIPVPSPTRFVSGTHLEIRQDGDAVVVTDLGSTNGTVLFPPAGAGERLRQGTSRTVLPGTRVDIGDGNIVEILPVSGDESSLPPAKNRKAQP